MTLTEFLQQHPWPKEWVERGQSLDYLWSFDVPSRPEALWPSLIDTSALNQRLGFPSMVLEEREGRLWARTTSVGVRVEWEEVPWEWEYEKSFSLSRIFQRGPAYYARIRYMIEDVRGHGSRLWVYTGWIPRGMVWRSILALGMPVVRQRHQRAIQDMVQRLGAAVRSPSFVFRPFEPVAMSAEVHEKLSLMRNALLAEGVHDPAVHALIHFVKTASDHEAERLRVKTMAQEWKLPLQDVLQVFLHATRKGLLMLTWDIVCPHCRGPRKTITDLGEVPTRGNCEPCGIDFDSTGLNGIEVSFHIHPSIRAVSPRMYCSAEAAAKPHIKYQQTLAPDEDRVIPTRLGPGRYRLRLKGDKDFGMVDIERGATIDSIHWDGAVLPSAMTVAPAPALALHNASRMPQTFIMEEYEADRDALRPADLFVFQEFRDLFTEQAVAAGIQLDVGTHTILFTDIVGSTRFYETVGDSGAFAVVREHFVKAYEVVRSHHGAIVKNIGDAIMAVFVTPSDAVLAAVDLQAYFNGRNASSHLRLRASLHVGPCLAVNLDHNIDYFGSTVNLAAKLQGAAGAGQIVFTEAVMREPAVARYWEASGITVERVEFPMYWADGVLQVFRVAMS